MSEVQQMKDMVKAGKAIDVSVYPKPDGWGGDYLLPYSVVQQIDAGYQANGAGHNPDFCDLRAGQWIWWIGRHHKTGQVRASLSFTSELNNEYKQLFQR